MTEYAPGYEPTEGKTLFAEDEDTSKHVEFLVTRTATQEFYIFANTLGDAEQMLLELDEKHLPWDVVDVEDQEVSRFY